jgi:hypothetical protein
MILSLLNELAATTSTNDKLALLKSHKEDNLVIAVFRLAYNPRIKFWIKKRPELNSVYHKVYHEGDLYNALIKLVDTIADRKLTGNAAIEYVSGLLENLCQFDQEVLYRIIERDLKCGVNTKLINKVWKDLIPEYPVLLCGKFNEKTEKNIKYTAIFQCKMDSSRINFEFDNGKFVSATTRNGNVLDITEFDDIVISDTSRVVLDGELMWRYPDGRVAERKVSNGYVTKAVRGTITEEEAKGLYAVIWDYIPYEDFILEVCNIPYVNRFRLAVDAISSENAKLIIVESEIVNSREEVMEKYQRNLERGEEGGILKSINGIWEAKRSKYQLKLKAEDHADLLVVGYTLGTPGTQFEGMLGSLLCQTSCGQLEVGVGSGFKHKRGERDNPESYVGKIIQVKYNCIISNKGSDKKSLFLPIYDGIRDDKTTANSLEDLL